MTQYLVPLRDVDRELNKQMKAIQGGGPALQRARMSNLVIFCNSLEQSIEVNDQITAITAVHPTRTILLVGEPPYFSRFGFQAAPEAKLPGPVDQRRVMWRGPGEAAGAVTA